tara:strand:+ start:675 stop:1367 length:693 start_codon:yes stop_codon:yes gene_type:complete
MLKTKTSLAVTTTPVDTSDCFYLHVKDGKSVKGKKIEVGDGIVKAMFGRDKVIYANYLVSNITHHSVDLEPVDKIMMREEFPLGHKITAQAKLDVAIQYFNHDLNKFDACVYAGDGELSSNGPVKAVKNAKNFVYLLNGLVIKPYETLVKVVDDSHYDHTLNHVVIFKGMVLASYKDDEIIYEYVQTVDCKSNTYITRQIDAEFLEEKFINEAISIDLSIALNQQERLFS